MIVPIAELRGERVVTTQWWAVDDPGNCNQGAFGNQLIHPQTGDVTRKWHYIDCVDPGAVGLVDHDDFQIYIFHALVRWEMLDQSLD